MLFILVRVIKILGMFYYKEYIKVNFFLNIFFRGLEVLFIKWGDLNVGKSIYSNDNILIT